MTFVSQHLKTTNPEAVAAVQANDQRRTEFMHEARQFAKRHGATHFRIFNLGGSLRIGAFEWDGERPDGWTKSGEPMKPNKSAYQELEALACNPEQVPGVPIEFHLSNHLKPGEGWFMATGFRVADGTAYARFSQSFDTEHTSPIITIGDFWKECLESEWVKAGDAKC